MEFNATAGLIADWTGGSLINGHPDIGIKTITTDSRNTGEDSLFVPIIGERFDGHQFIEKLVQDNSIAAFLTMKKDLVNIKEQKIAAILCDDTLKAYGYMALHHRKRMPAEIIAVTGTNGKTTTKEMLWSILQMKSDTLKNEKNYNNEIGVPYTLLGLKENHKYAVIELGMNHTGEIDILTKIARPDIALITNAGEGHLEFLGTVENVAKAKSEIMNGMKSGSSVILNSDSQCFDILSGKAGEMKLKVKTFGLVNDADVKPGNYKLFKDSIRFNYKNYEFNIPAYGIHNIYNALAAISASEILNIDYETVRNALKDFKNVDMRSQVIEKEFIIINDTYNSNPLSARYAIESVREIFPGKRKIAVFSDMKELGERSGIFHNEIGGMIFKSGFDLLLTWGEMAGKISEGARETGMKKQSAIHFDDKADLIDYVIKQIDKGDVVLVKGSRSMKMEGVVDALIH